MNELLERQFRLRENGTTVSTEVIAGLTTFATMAYILAVVPTMMGEAGLPARQVLTAMVVMVFLSTMGMALYTNRPFAMAPGMDSVAIFSVTVIQLQKVPVEIACGILFLSGMLFFGVTVLGIREFITGIIPKGIKIAIGASVGLFLCVLGLRNAQVIAANAQKTALSFGDLTNPAVTVAVVGFVVLLALEARRVRGSALISILAATLIGVPLGVTKLPTDIFIMPAGIDEVAFRFDILGAFDVRYLPFVFTFFLADFFSSIGTALGVGGKAGFLDKDGNLPGIERVFMVDSVAATVGSMFTLPVLLTYLESGAGVDAGGRTGLTAVTTAMLFIMVLVVTPLALMIPAAATASILVYVGMSMLIGMKNLDYNDVAQYIPAFLCIALTIFTFNIGNGISAAIIAYVIMMVSAGRMKNLSIGHYLLAGLLCYYFYSMAQL